MDDETGEFSERQLLHQNGEAEKFYRELKQRGVKVRIGMEATGHSRWFEQLLGGLNIELWVARPDRNRWEHARPVLRTVTQRNDFRAYAGK